jgi:hypothetical protein
MSLSNTHDSFGFSVAQGNVPYFSVQRAYGTNSAINVGVREDIWSFGGTYVFPSDAGESLVIKSTNAADTSHYIKVEGLDENFDLTGPVIVALNGTTPVALPGLWSRVESIMTVGDTATAGDVLVTDVLDTNTYGHMLQSRQAPSTTITTIPAGHTGYAMVVGGSIGKDAGGTESGVIGLQVRPVVPDGLPGAGTHGPRLTYGTVNLNINGTTMYERVLERPFKVPEKTDLVLYGESSSNGMVFTGYIEIILEKN